MNDEKKKGTRIFLKFQNSTKIKKKNRKIKGKINRKIKEKNRKKKKK